jgi:hypothetical protein
MTAQDLAAMPRVAVHLGFFLARAEQQKLIDAVQAGATVIASGELPAFDETMAPCRLLADFVADLEAGRVQAAGRLLYSTGNVFNDERAFLGNLRRAGWEKRIAYGEGLRAFVYRDGDHFYVLFFNFDRHGAHHKSVTFQGHRLDLTVGSKTCGVVHVRAGTRGQASRMVSYLVKGINEFEGERAQVRLRLGDQEIRVDGDGSGYDVK